MRKLATASLSFSAAVFLANTAWPESWLVISAILCALTGAALFAVHERPLRTVKIAALSAAVGFLVFSVHAKMTTEKAAGLAGETREITARVKTFPEEYERYACMECVLEEAGRPRLRFIVYDYNELLSSLKPGQLVRFTGKISRADIRRGEESDYYISNNIYLIVNTKAGDCAVLEDGFPLWSLPQYIRRAVTRSVERCFPADAAPFIKSVIAGDRRDYNEDVPLKSAISHAGFAHVIAVSGMHVAFLAGFLMLILGTNWLSSLLSIAIIWLFVLVTGASPSAVRAGVMQTLVIMAPLVGRENDPLTSLSAALALILLFNPFSAASVSLQLSFGAMAGILFFGGRIFKRLREPIKDKERRKKLFPVFSVISSSLSVMVFTAPLTVVYFGYLSVLAPLMNVLCIWAVSVCFAGGYAACALSFVPALGRAAGWLIAWPARYIFFVARCLSKIPFSTVIFEKPLSFVWLASFYLFFFATFFAKKSARRKSIVTGILSLCVLAAYLLVPAAHYRRGSYMTAIGVGQGQSLAVLSGNNTLLIDCGATGSGKDPGELTASYLLSRGRYRVDALMLTHLHADHANGVETLLERIKIGKLILQSNYEDSDGLLHDILASCERNGTEVIYITEDTSFHFGELRAEIFAPSTKGKANELCLTAKISAADYDMVVTADVSKNAERDIMKRHDLTDCELLIVGHHGSKYSSADDFLENIGADTAIISVGYNTYGHPTAEVLEKLEKYGYRVYRTDTDGTVELRVG